jgi:hypothetical protein
MEWKKSVHKISVVTSVNGDPRYTSFFPWWVKFWSQVARLDEEVALQLHLAYCGGEDHLPDVASEVVATTYPRVTSIPSTTRSQLARLHLASQLPESCGTVITTDIDLFPLSLNYFKTLAENAGNSFVVARDVLAEGQYPICYLAARPHIWREVVGGHLSAEEWFESVAPYVEETRTRAPRETWFVDQMWIYQRVKAWSEAGGEVLVLSDQHTGFRRLDRSIGPRLLFAGLKTGLIRPSAYVDYHAHRPALKYEALFGRLLRHAEP